MVKIRIEQKKLKQQKYSFDWPSDKIKKKWTILRIARKCPPPGWESLFQRADPELELISSILEEKIEENGEIYPKKKDIFAAFRLPLANVKVVIFGQDPYHQSILLNDKVLPRAVGMSFSVRTEDMIPVSLKNIYKELQNTIPGFKVPDHGNLEEWQQQGVFLLNSCLTVDPGSAGSHRKLWIPFIKKCIAAIIKQNPKCIFVLWGNEAQNLRELIGEKSIILEAAHPSGYSANKGFFGCDHFNLINKYLVKYGKEKINWQISSREELNKEELNKEELNKEELSENKEPVILSDGYKRNYENIYQESKRKKDQKKKKKKHHEDEKDEKEQEDLPIFF